MNSVPSITSLSNNYETIYNNIIGYVFSRNMNIHTEEERITRYMNALASCVSFAHLYHIKHEVNTLSTEQVWESACINIFYNHSYSTYYECSKVISDLGMEDPLSSAIEQCRAMLYYPSTSRHSLAG
jgi:hypothetical protein